MNVRDEYARGKCVNVPDRHRFVTAMCASFVISAINVPSRSGYGRRDGMRRPRWTAAVIPLSIALVVAGCGGGGGGDESGDNGAGKGDPQKNENTEITVFGTEPERPLVPGDTNESGGSKIIDALFTGLMDYDPVSGQPKLANAESFELTKPNEYTIKLKKDWKFHDGTPVQAHNYVDAWNYTA